MAGQIWLIGGTQESVAIATALAEATIPFVVTVTTENARGMYGLVQNRVHVGPIASEVMGSWVRSQSILGILDASHPFATAVSVGAIAAAAAAQLPYLRFERAVLDSPKAEKPEVANPETGNTVGVQQVHLVPDLTTLLTVEHLAGQRVLLVLGYRMLRHFEAWQSSSTLFARILPSQTAIEAALRAGFTSDRLIALRPPVSVALERSLWQQWGITKVIAKCSGRAGGELTKRSVAAELTIPLWLIQRPSLVYPQQTDSVGMAIRFAQQISAGSSLS